MRRSHSHIFQLATHSPWPKRHWPGHAVAVWCDLAGDCAGQGARNRRPGIGMTTKTKALAKLIAVVLMIPVHGFVCLIGSAIIVIKLFAVGIILGNINDKESNWWEPLFEIDVVAGYSAGELVFVVCWLLLAMLFFGRVNRKLI